MKERKPGISTKDVEALRLLIAFCVQSKDFGEAPPDKFQINEDQKEELISIYHRLGRLVMNDGVKNDSKI